MAKDNIGTAAATAGAVVSVNAFYAELTAAVYELRWMVLAVVVLVAADFITGLTASVRVKGEDFRFSRAGRRTCAKLAEYFTYLVIGVTLGRGLEPLGLFTYLQSAAVGLGVAALWEIDSIMGHVCDLHGVKARFSIKKLFIALVKKKDKAVGEAVEEAMEGEKPDKPNQPTPGPSEEG